MRGVQGVPHQPLDVVTAVLLHDAAEHDDFVPATIDALPKILAYLAERGLRSVTLSALVGPAEEPEREVPRRANQES